MLSSSEVNRVVARGEWYGDYLIESEKNSNARLKEKREEHILGERISWGASSKKLPMAFLFN